MIDLLFASIIQGVTEFIPVSSSLHLLIYGSFFANKTLILLLIITMHLGSILGLFFFCLIDARPKMDIFKSIKFNKIILVSTLPIFIFGFFFYSMIADINEINYLLIFTTIFFGILLFLSDHFSKNDKSLYDITYYDSFIIGLFQCFALIPGVSRSASIIIASRTLKINRESSVIFSLILSIPVIIGAFSLAVFKLDLNKSIETGIWIEAFFSLIFSFISSYITLKFFYKFSRVNGFSFFAIYRVMLGIILLLNI